MNDIFLKKIVQDAIQVKYESVGQIQANTPKKKIKSINKSMLTSYIARVHEYSNPSSLQRTITPELNNLHTKFK